MPDLSEPIIEILHDVLIEIRWHCRHSRVEQAGALADAAHNIPTLAANGELDLQRVKENFANYQEKYRTEPRLYDYVELLSN